MSKDQNKSASRKTLATIWSSNIYTCRSGSSLAPFDPKSNTSVANESAQGCLQNEWSGIDRPITAQRWQPISMWCYHAHHHRWFDLCMGLGWISAVVINTFASIAHTVRILAAGRSGVSPCYVRPFHSMWCLVTKTIWFQYSTQLQDEDLYLFWYVLSCSLTWPFTRRKPMEARKIWSGASNVEKHLHEIPEVTEWSVAWSISTFSNSHYW